MMEFQVLLMMALVVASRGIIVTDPIPLTHSTSAGYASQYSFPSSLAVQDTNVVYGAEQGAYTGLAQYSRAPTGSQYASNYPTVHHPAEFTFASPPVRHAEPISYPLPPAPVREDTREPQPTPTLYVNRIVTFRQPQNSVAYPAAEVHQNGLLGVAYSQATDVSRMSYSNSYGVSYGY